MILIEKGPAPLELEQANAALTSANLKIYGTHGKGTRIKSSAKDASGDAQKLAADTIYITAAYRAGAVKARLVESHHAKCAYCETRILAISHGDVEHFRPKSEYTDGANKGMGYFWLAYDWVNLYLGCQVCNETYKGTYFPMMPAVEGLIDASVRLEPGDDPAAGEEVAVLFDPGLENPRAFIRFDPETAGMEARPSASFAVDASRVGKNVMLLGLNRPDLVAARHRHVCFLRSMFVLMGHGILADSGIQEVLTRVNQRIAALAGAPDFGTALGFQKALAADCESVYRSTAAGPGGENAWAALRWLCFSVAPMAEYSGLAQDCVAAWTVELLGAVRAVQSQGITMSPGTPVAQSYTATSNVLGWPPLRLHQVPAHVAALQRAVSTYVEQKAGELNNLREAVREELYDELNALVADFNEFHQNGFDPVEAEDVYMSLREDLWVIGDSLEEIGASARAAERKQLLAFLDQEATAVERARCSVLDPRLNQAWNDFQLLHARTPAAEAVWKRAVETVRIGGEISGRLGVVLKGALQQNNPDPTPPAAFAIPAMLPFSGAPGALLAGLSPTFGRLVAFAAEGYGSWVNAALAPYQRRWAIHMAGEQGIREKRGELERAWPSPDDLAALSTFLQAASGLQARVDQLIEEYNDTGWTSGSWRWDTCHSMYNFLVSVEKAREKHLPSLLDPDDRIVPPNPSANDPWHPAPTTYALKPQQPLTWAVSTAAKKLADFHAARAKLTTSRKLTAKQQETLDGLVQEDARVRAMIAKVHALREAQRYTTDDDDDD